jgi:hypothetical protein
MVYKPEMAKNLHKNNSYAFCVTKRVQQNQYPTNIIVLEKVFGKKSEMSALEAIVHPEANRLTTEWITAQNDKKVNKNV